MLPRRIIYARICVNYLNSALNLKIFCRIPTFDSLMIKENKFPLVMSFYDHTRTTFRYRSKTNNHSLCYFEKPIYASDLLSICEGDSPVYCELLYFGLAYCVGSYFGLAYCVPFYTQNKGGLQSWFIIRSYCLICHNVYCIILHF